MTFAKRVFTIAGVYGLIVLGPLYFLEERIGRDLPPPITHPEFFYGFIGVTVAWQFLFLMLGRDPVRHRPLMLACILEKLSFAAAAVPLFLLDRIAMATLLGGMVDLIFGGLFVAAFVKTKTLEYGPQGSKTCPAARGG